MQCPLIQPRVASSQPPVELPRLPAGPLPQVRALSREVGALKDELGREGRRRERLAVRAKECEELLAAAEAKTKSLSYVNL